MKPQNYEKENNIIKETFIKLKQKDPDRLKERIKLSWSNWGFGMEPLKKSLERLKNNDIDFIELHGNRYGDDLGYDPGKVKGLFSDMDMEVSGICGMFSKESEFASNSPAVRQRAIDYMRRNVELGPIPCNVL